MAENRRSGPAMSKRNILPIQRGTGATCQSVITTVAETRIITAMRTGRLCQRSRKRVRHKVRSGRKLPIVPISHTFDAGEFPVSG